MITSISSGLLVFEKLKNNTELKDIVSDRIYPVLPQHKTEFPFLTYSKETAKGVYTKDLLTHDEAIFSFTAWSNNYSDTCNVLEAVREIFDGYKDKFFRQCVMIDNSDEAADGLFAQAIIFKFTIRPINTN